MTNPAQLVSHRSGQRGFGGVAAFGLKPLNIKYIPIIHSDDDSEDQLPSRTNRRPYQRVHSPIPTPSSRVSLPHADALVAGRDGMTPSACRGPGERCR